MGYFLVQLRQFGPMQSAIVMMGSVIAEIASEQIVPAIRIIKRRFERAIGIQACMMLIGGPCCHEQTHNHWKDKNKQRWHRTVDSQQRHNGNRNSTIE